MLFSFQDIFELFRDALQYPLEFILFWTLFLCIIPKLSRWTALPLLLTSLIIAIKDFIELSGWNFIGTLFFLVALLIAPIIGTFILLIPKTKKFFLRNYGDLNSKQVTQFENKINIDFENKQEFLLNLKVGVLSLVIFFEFLYPVIFHLFIGFAVLVGKITGQT